MQQISFIELPKKRTCSDCGKNCQSQRGCLITQIVNELSKEQPTKFMAVNMKLLGIPEGDIAYCLSNCKDYKNRNGSFSKCFWGSLKIK